MAQKPGHTFQFLSNFGLFSPSQQHFSPSILDFLIFASTNLCLANASYDALSGIVIGFRFLLAHVRVVNVCWKLSHTLFIPVLPLAFGMFFVLEIISTKMTVPWVLITPTCMWPHFNVSWSSVKELQKEHKLEEPYELVISFAIICWTTSLGCGHSSFHSTMHCHYLLVVLLTLKISPLSELSWWNAPNLPAPFDSFAVLQWMMLRILQNPQSWPGTRFLLHS